MKRLNGHSNIRQTEGSALYKWSINQRKMYEREEISLHRLQLLKQINFRFNKLKAGRPKKVRVEYI